MLLGLNRVRRLPRLPVAQAVREQGADMGLALDGDADRLQMVDAQGRLFNGDELLYVLADDRLARDEVVPGVVGTLMTNLAVEQALRERGVELVRAKVGDRYVLETLQENLCIICQFSTFDKVVNCCFVCRKSITCCSAFTSVGAIAVMLMGISNFILDP